MSFDPQDYISIEHELGAHNYKPLDVVLSRGEGVWLWDTDGNKYLDCLAAYSAVFPWFQKDRGKKRWTLWFLPAMSISMAPPLFLMGGVARPIVGGLLLAVGGTLLWGHARDGWRLKPVAEHDVHLEET